MKQIIFYKVVRETSVKTTRSLAWRPHINNGKGINFTRSEHFRKNVLGDWNQFHETWTLQEEFFGQGGGGGGKINFMRPGPTMKNDLRQGIHFMRTGHDLWNGLTPETAWCYSRYHTLKCMLLGKAFLSKASHPKWHDHWHGITPETASSARHHTAAGVSWATLG